MSSLVLLDRRDGTTRSFEGGPVVIGRADTCDVVVSGPGSEVVSAVHTRLLLRDGTWRAVDAGGRNGTFVDGARVPEGGSLALGDGATLSLGSPGLEYAVELVEEAARVALSLIHTESGERWEGSGPRLRVGRTEECEIVLMDELLVSRVHCEIVPGPGGKAILRDLQSRHGTWLDGEAVTADAELREGARIRFGVEGPELFVELVAVRSGTPAAPPASALPPTEILPAQPPAPAPPAPQPAAASVAAASVAAAGPGKPPASSGRTAYFKALISATEEKHASRTRGAVWAFVLLLVLAVGGALGVSELRLRQTQAELAAQRAELDASRARADSVRAADLAEYRRLEAELEAAREGSAPALVLDSLRTALEDASTRTAFLEQALQRAREEMDRQLQAGDSLRAAQQVETERLRSVLASSQNGGVSAAELAALREEVRAAEERAAQLEVGLRAMRGADLATIAEANQEATGLVSVFAGESIYDGSGFVLTSTGYFVTNRHVANPEGHIPDSVHITMADQRTGHRARVVAVSPSGGPDLAVLQIPGYVGPHVTDVDWDGSRARQGEPAALIGFPAGVAAALDATRTVRTSMAAGIFSKVTETQIQFDGFTIGGSSGSPIFNADGEVVAVHSSGLREAAGLGFAVPVRLVLPLLPSDGQQEVGRTP